MNSKKTEQQILIRILSTFMLSLLYAITPAFAAQASELVILYSNDIRGETDPCG